MISLMVWAGGRDLSAKRTDHETWSKMGGKRVQSRGWDVSPNGHGSHYLAKQSNRLPVGMHCACWHTCPLTTMLMHDIRPPHLFTKGGENPQRCSDRGGSSAISPLPLELPPPRALPHLRRGESEALPPRGGKETAVNSGPSGAG